MRISDWSSDLCSSDLPILLFRGHAVVRSGRGNVQRHHPNPPRSGLATPAPAQRAGVAACDRRLLSQHTSSGGFISAAHFPSSNAAYSPTILSAENRSARSLNRSGGGGASSVAAIALASPAGSPMGTSGPNRPPSRISSGPLRQSVLTTGQPQATASMRAFRPEERREGKGRVR